VKSKKRILGIAIGLALVASLLFGGVALADDPTTVDVNWNGAGAVIGSVTCGDDATASFGTSASHHQVGEFHATDSNDNPYTYGVDSCVFTMETSITDGGGAYLLVSRTDSKESSYGLAGQQSYIYVSTDDGDATLQNRSSTNYASMKDCNYGWNSSDHITVAGASTFELLRWMNSGNGDFAGLRASGSGSADLDCMSSEANGASVRLGWGCGCYTNADFTATGAGLFELQANGDTTATTAMAPGMTGASSFDFVAWWTGGSTFTVPDYSTTAQ